MLAASVDYVMDEENSAVNTGSSPLPSVSSPPSTEELASSNDITGSVCSLGFSSARSSPFLSNTRHTEVTSRPVSPGPSPLTVRLKLERPRTGMVEESVENKEKPQGRTLRKRRSPTVGEEGKRRRSLRVTRVESSLRDREKVREARNALSLKEQYRSTRSSSPHKPITPDKTMVLSTTSSRRSPKKASEMEEPQPVMLKIRLRPSMEASTGSPHVEESIHMGGPPEQKISFQDTIDDSLKIKRLKKSKKKTLAKALQNAAALSASTTAKQK